MIDIIRSATRGTADHGWLQTRYSFSFADYYDPARVHFGHLRVINEDHIAPGKGFDTHPHKDMEIITYVISGAIEHRDSMGNGAVVNAGDVQRMTAGTGIRHSEFNPSTSGEVHLLQVWIFPERKNLAPGYEQKQFARVDKLNRLCLVASRDGRNDSISIHQDVDLYAGILETSHDVSLGPVDDRRIFVQVISGALDINGEVLSAGDGARLQETPEVNISAKNEAEFLLFNLG